MYNYISNYPLGPIGEDISGRRPATQEEIWARIERNNRAAGIVALDGAVEVDVVTRSLSEAGNGLADGIEGVIQETF